MPRPDSIDNIRRTLDLAGRELQILHQISQSISCSLDLDQVLREIIELVVEVTRGDSCLVYLLDDAEESLVLRASKNPHPRIIGAISLKLGEGITGWVAREAKTVAISRHASKDPRFKLFHHLPEDRYEAFLSTPIVAPMDRVIGVINVQHRKSHRHGEQEKTLLSIIGHQVGSAIENARLYQDARRRAVHLETLAQVGQAIVSPSYLEEILELIVGIVSQMMQAKVCSIMLLDKGKRELVLKAARCSSPEYWQRPNLKIGKSLLSRVVREKSPLYVADVSLEEDYQYPELAKKEGICSLLSLPMIVKGSVTGVVNLYSAQERAFSEEEVRVLRTVADQAAMAIENTRLALEARESQEALEARKTIERAKTILQRQAGLTEDEAYRRLQQQSMKTRRSMREIADAIILASEVQTKD